MTIAASPPIEIPLGRLSVRQKWDLVQALCDDISGQDAAQLEMPAWHADVLEEREERRLGCRSKTPSAHWRPSSTEEVLGSIAN